MSIRNIHNVPCATCKADTMHMALKCTICGTVYESNGQARARHRIARITFRVNVLGMSKGEALGNMHKHDAKHAAISRRTFQETPTYTPSMAKAGTFGKGRSRTR